MSQTGDLHGIQDGARADRVDRVATDSLVGVRIAFIRYDVLTRGSDLMADILAQQLRIAGAQVTIYHARGRFQSCLPLQAACYRELHSHSALGVILELVFRSWPEHDLIVSDFIPLIFAMRFRRRGGLLYFAQSHIADCYRTPKRQLMSWLYRRLLVRHSIAVFCSSPFLARVFERAYGVRPVVLAEGDRRRLLAFQNLRGTGPSPQRRRKFVLLSIVGTNHAKGADILTSALHSLDRDIGSELEVWLVGAPWKIELGHIPVKHFGVVPPGRLKSLYLGADIFLFTSRFENYPSPPFEAMTCRCPVVSTPVAEYLRDGVNAFLVTANDPEGLAQAVRTVLESNTARHRLVDGGLQTVRETEEQLAAAPSLAEDFQRCLAAPLRQGPSMENGCLHAGKAGQVAGRSPHT